MALFSIKKSFDCEISTLFMINIKIFNLLLPLKFKQVVFLNLAYQLKMRLKKTYIFFQINLPAR